MKAYPQIQAFKGPMPECLAFHKYDGSNLRFQWDRKKGWWQFGTRTRLLTTDDAEYGAAIPMFLSLMAEPLERKFKDNKHLACTEAIAYCEWFGPNSFAGQHDVATLQMLGFDVKDNDPKRLVLFDVNLHKKGFVGPHRFVEQFSDMPIPPVVYHGDLTEQFVEDVREGKYPVGEGVVCKGGEGHKLWMCKVKTFKYRDELQRRMPNWKNYWE